MTDQYHIRVAKEQFTFSAAHFITFGDNICERLHGHNYHVEIELSGPLNSHGYVVDFIAVRDAVTRITNMLDHHVLLPARHPLIHVEKKGSEWEVHFEDRRWVFPLNDAIVLPVENTTAELLARWLADRILEELPGLVTNPIERIRVAVDENSGQWGICERALPLDSSSRCS